MAGLNPFKYKLFHFGFFYKWGSRSSLVIFFAGILLDFLGEAVEIIDGYSVNSPEKLEVPEVGEHVDI